ncbi:MAG: outer membrane protein assembly factor BamD [Treponema sp.]|jgi:outer membrane protein assembly factor BamD (BamD/ComL family)|nr:outer membrane protein assembly factor BamD [Treponema sp.]
MRIKAFFAVGLAAFFACASGPVEIPPDMPPNKIIQSAQEASDNNKYRVAIQYYEALLERYGAVPEYLATAEYEIAFIHYKDKKYVQAREEFNMLLDRYESSQAGAYPPKFKILSDIVLARIESLGY